MDDAGEEIAISEYYLENIDATVVSDTEDSEKQAVVLNGQEVMVISKDNSYQVAWINSGTQTMCAISGSNGMKDVVNNLVEKLISAS